MSARELPLVIAGGGLSGCLVALALAERRPDVPILLLEGEERFGGNHVWSFFDSDIEEEDRWLVADLIACRWPDHDIRFPRRSRTLAIGYNSINSSDLDRLVRSRLQADQYSLGRAVLEVEADHVLIEGGDRINASAVIDCRGPGLAAGLDLAWQKFVGRTYRFERPHGCARPTIMDAQVDQATGYRFVYTLPFSETLLMVEDTYYSTSPDLDVPALRQRLDAYLQARNWAPVAVEGEETGVLPVLLSGDLEALWPLSEPPVARLGLRGGFFHPTTGYSLPDAVRNAALLARQTELTSPALHHLFHGRAALLWKQRAFYQLLNRMLFRAAAPQRRYRVLQHFYRLPEPLISRFYAGKLTGLDKLRIVSGRPPVPIRKALAALRAAA